MGSGGKPRWKLSSLYHRSPAATPTAPPELPTEFICPISGRLMADPVILPSGRTFERGCVQACQHVGVAAPPGDGEAALAAAAAAADHHLPLLIPNMALRAAIHNWCDAHGVDRPQPVDPAAALHLVRRLSYASSPAPSSSSSSSSVNNSLQTCPSPASRAAATSPYLTATAAAASPTFTFSSSSSSCDATFSCERQCPPPNKVAPESSAAALEEEEILAGLGDPRTAEQEAALLLLRSASRGGGREGRAALCTPRILAALRAALLSRELSVQSHAAASLLNLSLHPPNRSNIVRAGAVPALVDVLKGGAPDAQGHAAAALFSLSMDDDDNKAALGALGALPALLHLLSRSSGADRGRQDAAMALYHLSMARTNRSKLVKLGAVKTLLGVATRPSREVPTTLPTLALMVLCNLAACGEAREAMMEAGAVEALVSLLRTPAPAGPRDPAWDARTEHCVAALYWMSRGSRRFRGLATAAGAEEALRAVVSLEAAEDGKRWRTREMARRALHAAAAAEDGARDEVVFGDLSEPALRGQRRAAADVGGYNSTKV